MQKITISGGFSGKIASVFLSIGRLTSGKSRFEKDVTRHAIRPHVLHDILSGGAGHYARYAVVANKRDGDSLCYLIARFQYLALAMKSVRLCKLINEKYGGDFEFQTIRIGTGFLIESADQLPLVDDKFTVKPAAVISAVITGLRETIEREAA